MAGADTIAWLGVIGAVAALALALAALVLAGRATRAGGDESLGSARISEIERRVLQSARRIEALERELDSRPGDGSDVGSVEAPSPTRTRGRISRIGLVRFDAFDDTGGGQSFALALIDDAGHGVVLTSLHSRQTTRLYVKDIRNGVADAPLSQEEEGALRRAGIVA